LFQWWWWFKWNWWKWFAMRKTRRSNNFNWRWNHNWFECRMWKCRWFNSFQ
jgi:hypothetical protein